MNRQGANGAGGSPSRKWPVLVRVMAQVALALGFVGLVIGGPVGGSVMILAGLGVVLCGAAMLADVGGAGTEFAIRYQNTIQRRVPRAAPPQPSQRAWITRIVGIVALAVGLGYMAAGVLALLGVIGAAPP